MPDSPVISVIIIFLNEEDVLARAIESVQRQSLSEWELLLVDDGSTDGSVALAHRYCAADSKRIRYLEHPGKANRGKSASRNLGLVAARGRYVTFLDADDEYLPQRLQRPAAILDANPSIDAVQNEYVLRRDDLVGLSDDLHHPPSVWIGGQVIEPPHALIAKFAIPRIFDGTPNITVRRGVVLELGGFEETFTDLFDDDVFFTKLYLERRVYVLSEVLAVIHQSWGSSGHPRKNRAWSQAGPWQSSKRQLVGWQIDYIRSRGCRHPLLERSLADLGRSIGHISTQGVRMVARSITVDAVRRLVPVRMQRKLLAATRRAEIRDAWARYRKLAVDAHELGLKWGLSRSPTASTQPDPQAGVESAPVVSVIIIFYQAERFLAEAIDSVISQSFANWELLLVDDGSSDGGSAIARAYVEKNPARMHYLTHPDGENRGMAASRKLGMKVAAGRYIAFLDADDIYLPQRLERHVTLLDKFDCPGIVIGTEQYWYSWDDQDSEENRGRNFVNRVGASSGYTYLPPDLLTLLVLPLGVSIPGICSMTFHHPRCDDLPEVPDCFTGLAEDLCLLAGLLATRRSLVDDECVALYRQHPWSSMSRAAQVGPSATADAEFQGFVWLDGLVRELGIRHVDLMDALALRILQPAPPLRLRIDRLLFRTAITPVKRILRFLHQHFPRAFRRPLSDLFAASRDIYRRRYYGGMERRMRLYREE